PRSPRPWGVTALFAEATGDHPPLEIAWPFEKSATLAPVATAATEPVRLNVPQRAVPVSGGTTAAPLAELVKRPRQQPVPSFSNFWEFAVAVNRSDAAALALASNGASS